MRRTKENKNCPYCLSPMEEGQAKVRCPKCGVAHHAECWTANGRCSVYGCDGWVVWSGLIGERIAPDTEEKVDLGDARQVSEPVQTALCIECGRPIGAGQLTCRSCHARGRHWFENCFGPALLLFAGTAGLITLIAKAL